MLGCVKIKVGGGSICPGVLEGGKAMQQTSCDIVTDKLRDLRTKSLLIDSSRTRIKYTAHNQRTAWRKHLRS